MRIIFSRTYSDVYRVNSLMALPDGAYLLTVSDVFNQRGNRTRVILIEKNGAVSETLVNGAETLIGHARVGGTGILGIEWGDGRVRGAWPVISLGKNPGTWNVNTTKYRTKKGDVRVISPSTNGFTGTSFNQNPRLIDALTGKGMGEVPAHGLINSGWQIKRGNRKKNVYYTMYFCPEGNFGLWRQDGWHMPGDWSQVRPAEKNTAWVGTGARRQSRRPGSPVQGTLYKINLEKKRKRKWLETGSRGIRDADVHKDGRILTAWTEPFEGWISDPKDRDANHKLFTEPTLIQDPDRSFGIACAVRKNVGVYAYTSGSRTIEVIEVPLPKS